MSSRADFLTELIKKKELYSDIPSNLDPMPGTNSLSKKINEDSVKQSLKNLLLTEYGERFYQPTIGSRIRRLLFENATNTSNFLLEKLDSEIRKTIEQKEQRVKLIDVQVKSFPDNYGILVNIIFVIINKTEPINLDVILRKVR